MTVNPDLLRNLLTRAHERTEHIDSRVSAVQLYTEAARAAVDRLPEPWGTAIGAVLAIAAEHRRATGLSGNLGEHRSTLALALLVLEDELAAAPLACARPPGIPRPAADATQTEQP